MKKMKNLKKNRTCIKPMSIDKINWSNNKYKNDQAINWQKRIDRPLEKMLYSLDVLEIDQFTKFL